MNGETFDAALADERKHIESAKADAARMNLDADFAGIIAIIDRLAEAHRRDVEELATAIRRLAEDACGHCDARYCEGDGEQEHMPCRVVRESLQVADTYCPKPPPPESDDGMPF